MTLSIGIDLEEVRRFRHKTLSKYLTFYNSIFNKSELAYYLKYPDPYPHLAGGFAAKEAVIKCCNYSTRMLDIEIIRSHSNKPAAIIHHKKREISVQISISHTNSVAMAIAIMTSAPRYKVRKAKVYRKLLK